MNSYWERLRKRKLSRRAVLGGGLGAFGLAVVACDSGGGNEPGPGETPAAPDGEPKRGGTIIFGSAVPPTFGLDPHIELALGLLIFPKVYGYVLHQDPRDESIILDQGASWEQPDELTYVLRLQPGVRFQDIPPVGGREVEAEDVVASQRRFLEHPFVLSKIWHEEVLDTVEATDSLTVVVKTKRPYVYSLEALGSILAGVIIPQELASPEEDLNTKGVGSGPFMIDKVALKEEISIVRNPGYFRQPLPYVDRLVWKIVPDDATKMAALRARQIDATGLRDRIELDEARGISGDLSTSEVPSLFYHSFAMQMSKPLFSDMRVAEAIDIGIDRQAIIDKITFGDGEIMGAINQHMAEGFWALPESELREAYGMNLSKEERVAKARALLSSAGAEGSALTIRVPTLSTALDVATLLENQLKTIGLDVRLEPQELLVWLVNAMQGEFDAIVIPHLPYESPDNATRYYHSQGRGNVGQGFNYDNPEFDRLIVQSWGQFDRDERRATLLELQRAILQTHAPMLNLFTGLNYGASWNYVKGLQPELPQSLQQYVYTLWLDR